MSTSRAGENIKLLPSHCLKYGKKGVKSGRQKVIEKKKSSEIGLIIRVLYLKFRNFKPIFYLEKASNLLK